jgi:hypothetical protein
VAIELTPSPCCGVHPFDAQQVERSWWPEERRCLIVGESPGAPGAAYFYDPIPPRRDPITVRRHLLAGLTEAGVIAAPSLEAFRGAGLAFDHAIRCPVPLDVIEQERLPARAYRSRLVEERGIHIRDLIARWPKVWIMGHLARQAVTFADPSLRRTERGVIPPYVELPRYFVSAYFRRFDSAGAVNAVIGEFRRFFRDAEP